jgi:two-component system, OmpR family, sensor kinase
VTDPRDALVPGVAAPRPEVLNSFAAAPPPHPGPPPERPRRDRSERERPARAERSTALRWRLEGVPLQVRLLVILLVAVVTALLATGYLSQRLLRGYLIDQLDRQLKDSVNSMVGNAISQSLRSDPHTRGLPPLPPGVFVQVWYGQPGEAPELFPSGQTGPAFPTLAVDQYTVRPLDLHPRTLPSVSGNTTWRAVNQVLQLKTDRNDPGVLVYAQVAMPLTGVDDVVAKLQLVILTLGAALIALCAWFGWLAIRRSFQPLVEVEETAAAIAAGDLSRRIPDRPPSTEVGRLTTSLNGMLTQIESAFRAREASEARTRRFAADASHELRTPLVSIRGFAELFRQGAVPPDEVPRTMRRIEDEAKRMGSLVEDLLLLARLDEQRPGRTAPVHLDVLARDAVHDAHGLDPSREVRFVGDPGDPGAPVVVTGDEDRLRQVVTNLVGNAVRHTPPGSPIEVAVGLDGGQAVFEVRDHGAGLTPEQAERVFERFYRVDSSRQRGQGGGSGLGLSIVSAVVTAHGGTVEVVRTPGGGATFRARFPAAAQGADPPLMATAR